jgi:beta-lactam-binding protein with PASTA domain
MKKNNWIVRHLVTGAAVVAGILVLSIIVLKIITRHNQELAVPDFTGMTLHEAKSIAEENSLRLEVSDSVFLPRMRRGEIFRQNPAANSSVKKNRRILLTINSLQPRRVKMPLVTGYSLRQAKAELTSRQLKLGKLLYTRDMATNNVLGQLHDGREIPAGTLIEAESVIDLRVGVSPDDDRTSIPDLTGYALPIAKDILTDNSLNTGRIRYDNSIKTYNDSISGYVIKQDPSFTDSLAYPRGTDVSLTISTDKEKLREISEAKKENHPPQ